MAGQWALCASLSEILNAGKIQETLDEHTDYIVFTFTETLEEYTVYASKILCQEIPCLNMQIGESHDSSFDLYVAILFL